MPQIECPECGGTEIRSVDRVIVTCDVVGFDLVEGRVVPQYAETSSDVHWDSSEPYDFTKPYQCSGCDLELSDDDIRAVLLKLPSSSSPSSLPPGVSEPG